MRYVTNVPLHAQTTKTGRKIGLSISEWKIKVGLDKRLEEFYS
jgi:hypothetical protein